MFYDLIHVFFGLNLKNQTELKYGILQIFFYAVGASTGTLLEQLIYYSDDCSPIKHHKDIFY